MSKYMSGNTDFWRNDLFTRTDAPLRVTIFLAQIGIQGVKIFGLLFQGFWWTIKEMVNRNHHATAAAWRSTVET